MYSIIQRAHVVVVGAGLGRSPLALAQAVNAIKFAKAHNKYLVIDADGLQCINENPELVRGYPKCVITPNVNEFKRLAATTGFATCSDLSKYLGVVVFQKGEHDIICSDDLQLECSVASSPRRCGGQGDVLSGIIATTLAWADGVEQWNGSRIENEALVCAYAAGALTRTVSWHTFEQRGRSMVASDMLKHIQHGLMDVFETLD
jgi:ATP-dependent NAD(P)H-hydrate dehydratase